MRYQIGTRVKARLASVPLGVGYVVAHHNDLYNVQTDQGTYPLYEEEIHDTDTPMTKAQLEERLYALGLKVDDTTGTIGKFRDLSIGTGKDPSKLNKLKQELKSAGIVSRLAIVQNPDHPDHGKTYLEVLSFWYE